MIDTAKLRDGSPSGAINPDFCFSFARCGYDEPKILSL
jgi:hypothetical protein